MDNAVLMLIIVKKPHNNYLLWGETLPSPCKKWVFGCLIIYFIIYFRPGNPAGFDHSPPACDLRSQSKFFYWLMTKWLWGILGVLTQFRNLPLSCIHHSIFLSPLLSPSLHHTSAGREGSTVMMGWEVQAFIQQPKCFLHCSVSKHTVLLHSPLSFVSIKAACLSCLFS